MINFTLKQLYSFEAVVRLGSFTNAAKELYVTQPAVYMQIQQLMQNIGCELLNIKGKSITPTPVGKEFYNTCLEVIEKLESAKTNIDQMLDPETGHLQIAVATTANSFTSRLLSKFRKLYPKMTFHLDVTNRGRLLDKLKNKQVDLVIMGEPPNDDMFNTQAFMQNPLIVIAHPDHPLLKKKNNSIQDLSKETLITREKESGTRITVERITGMQINSDIAINSNEAIIEAVQAGLGIGFVSKHTVKLELQNNIIKQLSVERFPIMRNWHIVHNAKTQLSPIAERFKKFIIENSDLH